MTTENTTIDSQAGAEIKKANPLKGALPIIVIALAFVVSYVIFKYVFGNPANFKDNNNENQPLDGNLMGMVYKGGIIIPLGMTLLLTMITFVIERFVTIIQAGGRGSVDVFTQKIRMRLHDGDIDGAIEECDRQRGSVANVVKAGLRKYREVEKLSMDKDEKKLAIQQELEEASSLEMPMLQRNLVIVATIVSAGVLVGLLGTVIGMIRAFSALSNAGAPDAGELATGISEALMNTAMGIGNSLIALIFYNILTSIIDAMTYRMDEVGYSIVQTFDVRHK